MKKPVLFACAALAVVTSGFAEPLEETAANWWSGSRASGEWMGLRPTLEDRGIVITGKYLGTVYGLVAGGLEDHATYDEELKFDGRIDLAKLTGWEPLQGLVAVGGVRWRDGENINDFVGASPAFNPSSYQGGKAWRLLPFYLSYTTPELLGVKNLLTISGGWQNPYEFFARQEDAKLFRNNIIVSGKGISSNGVGWSSSYAAWGGTVKIVPNHWSYAQGGLYMAIPGDADTANHGFAMAGASPASSNGLFGMAELGVTPKIAGLPGKYAVGGYYWGLENTSFFGATYDAKFGFYGMAEQMLYREPSAGPEVADGGKTAPDGKSLKNPVAPVTKESKQGLRWLSFLNYAPKYDNAMPFFFYTGLVYEGLIPGRDQDQAGIALAYGNYSYYQILAKRESGVDVVDTYEGVLEFEYRFQVNKWLFAQPFLQYVIRPGGDGQVANATVLGLHFGVTF